MSLIEEIYSRRTSHGFYKLENVRRAYHQLGLDQGNVQRILVAGTNGKGSTVGFLSLLLHQSPLKVGCFTSPHMCHFYERFWVDGKHESDGDVESHLISLKADLDPSLFARLSFFEISLLLALYIFRAKGCDVEVLEVGLGGRLDATNIVEPILTIITSIGLDHQKVLGSTLKEICKEKSGITRPCSPHLIGAAEDSVFDDLISFSNSKENLKFGTDFGRKEGRFWWADQQLEVAAVLPPSLRQLKSYLNNAALSFAAFQIVLQKNGHLPPRPEVYQELDLDEIHSLRGRSHPYWLKTPSSGDPQKVFLDTGHNSAALDSIHDLIELQQISVVILTMLEDKPVDQFLSFFAQRQIKTLLFRNCSERSIKAAPNHKVYRSFDELWLNNSSSLQNEKIAILGSVIGLSEVLESTYFYFQNP